MRYLLSQIGLVAGFFTLCTASQALAALDVVGSAVYALPSSSGTAGHLDYPGGGLIFNLGLGQRVDLQLGGLVLTRGDSSLGTTDRVGTGVLGFGIKLERYFTLNLGGFYDYVLVNNTGNSQDAWGGLAGVTARVPLGAKVAFVFRADYQMYLNNGVITGGGNASSNSQILGSAGLSFGMFK